MSAYDPSVLPGSEPAEDPSEVDKSTHLWLFLSDNPEQLLPMADFKVRHGTDPLSLLMGPDVEPSPPSNAFGFSGGLGAGGVLGAGASLSREPGLSFDTLFNILRELDPGDQSYDVVIENISKSGELSREEIEAVLQADEISPESVREFLDKEEPAEPAEKPEEKDSNSSGKSESPPEVEDTPVESMDPPPEIRYTEEQLKEFDLTAMKTLCQERGLADNGNSSHMRSRVLKWQDAQESSDTGETESN